MSLCMPLVYTATFCLAITLLQAKTATLSQDQLRLQLQVASCGVQIQLRVAVSQLDCCARSLTIAVAKRDCSKSCSDLSLRWQCTGGGDSRLSRTASAPRRAAAHFALRAGYLWHIRSIYCSHI